MKTFLQQTKIKKWIQSHRFLVFVIFMITEMVIFYILYYNPYLQNAVFSKLVNFYASVSSKILNVFGFNTSVVADSIYSPKFSVSVKKGCDALEPMALLAAGILAFPAPSKSKIRGLLAGLTFLFILNIIRIITLYLTGIYKPDLFETMHVDVWQIIFILSGIVFWFQWIRKVMHKIKTA